MSTITATVVISVVAIALLAALVAFALHTKGDVKANGRIGAGTFNIEATEKSK